MFWRSDDTPNQILGVWNFSFSLSDVVRHETTALFRSLTESFLKIVLEADLCAQDRPCESLRVDSAGRRDLSRQRVHID